LPNSLPAHADGIAVAIAFCTFGLALNYRTIGDNRHEENSEYQAFEGSQVWKKLDNNIFESLALEQQISIMEGY
jgi:hypothetical protein